MCGIAGVWTRAERFEASLERLRQVSTGLAHRGPDGAGEWADPSAGLALAHRRLAIQDLTPAGDQPMASKDGRYRLVFNGEIYGFRELRGALRTRGIHFRGHSDTEVLLALIECDGVEETLDRIDGMFAFALWDARDRTLVLARDRLGEKPLYYGWTGDALHFASELRSLRGPLGLTEIDGAALCSYLRFGYVPAPASIFRHFYKLPAGAMLRLRQPERPEGFDPDGTPDRYWSVPAPGASGGLSPEDACANYRSSLREAVRRQLVADVPVGTLLSGGIDSTLVTALAQETSEHPIHSYTVGFAEGGYDESTHAAAIARHLGTRHTELRVTRADVLESVAGLPVLLDEPHANPSIIPSHLVARLARAHVTVCLSGDGGDETFAGYNRYRAGGTQARLARVPAFLRRGASRILGGLPAAAMEHQLRRLGRASNVQDIGLKLRKLADLLATDDLRALYLRLVSINPSPEGLLASGHPLPCHPSWARGPALEADHFVEWAMNVDLQSYLPDDSLAKVDRAAMRASLELRLPLLDRRVVEAALQVPLHCKLRGGETKWLLRQMLDDLVPRALVDRPKMGFTVPVGTWMRGPLRDWTFDQLNAAEARLSEWLDPSAIRGLERAFLAGRPEAALPVWSLAVLGSWSGAS